MNWKHALVFTAIFVLYFLLARQLLNFLFAPTMFVNLVVSILVLLIIYAATKFTVSKIF